MQAFHPIHPRKRLLWPTFAISSNSLAHIYMKSSQIFYFPIIPHRIPQLPTGFHSFLCSFHSFPCNFHSFPCSFIFSNAVSIVPHMVSHRIRLKKRIPLTSLQRKAPRRRGSQWPRWPRSSAGCRARPTNLPPPPPRVHCAKFTGWGGWNWWPTGDLIAI